MRRAVCVAALMVAAPAMARAQRASVRADVGILRMRSEVDGRIEILRGPALSVRGMAHYRSVGLEVEYTGGKTGGVDQSNVGRDIAEGTLLATYGPLPIVTFTAGARAWVQVSDVGTRRYAFGQIGLRTEVPVGDLLLARGEVWWAATGTTNMAAAFGTGRGGSAGLTLALPRTPLRAQLTYRIDRGAGDTPQVAESLEVFSLGIAIDLH